MPSATRKRLRNVPTVERVTTPTATCRIALISRAAAHTTPLFWLRAASAAGASSADAFLVHLGRRITTALRSLAEAAEAARAELSESRATLHAAIDARCDELTARVNSAEAIKATALECELIAVDAALERWRSESGDVRETISSLSDADLELQHATLASRLDAMDALLQALPTVVVEPPVVGIIADTPATLAAIAGFGRVIAPIPINAADLNCSGPPVGSCVHAGDTLCLRLSLGARHADQSAEELDVSLGMLANATWVQAKSGIEPRWQSLQATVEHIATDRCLVVSLQVPSSYTHGASISICALCEMGQPPMLQSLSVPMYRGITAPLRTEPACVWCTPCISPLGLLYCPVRDKQPSDVLVFGCDGTELSSIPISRLGFSFGTYCLCAAYVHGSAPSLLLSESDADTSRLVAIDPSSHAVFWRSAVVHHGGAENAELTVLLPLGVVVVCCGDTLFALRLSDGVRVGRCGGLGTHDSLVSADPVTGTVFGSAVSDVSGLNEIHAWSFAPDGLGIQITPDGPITAARSDRSFRPLAVVPPAIGKRISHLVVVAHDSDRAPELLVMSLPGRILVHTHNLRGLDVTRLVADPWGEALIVCDSVSDALCALTWPLQGMLPLE